MDLREWQGQLTYARDDGVAPAGLLFLGGLGLELLAIVGVCLLLPLLLIEPFLQQTIFTISVDRNNIGAAEGFFGKHHAPDALDLYWQRKNAHLT